MRSNNYTGRFIFILIVIIAMFIAIKYITNLGWYNMFGIGLLTITATATVLLAYLASTQLDQLERTSHADFCLRLDERYTSKETQKAKQIIHCYELQAQKELELANQEVNDTSISQRVGEKILSLKNEEASSKNYIILINFLDILETAAYFVNNRYVSEGEARSLFGDLIADNGRKYKPYIDELNDEDESNEECYKEILSYLKE